MCGGQSIVEILLLKEVQLAPCFNNTLVAQPQRELLG